MEMPLFDRRRLEQVPLPTSHSPGGETYLYAVGCDEFVKLGIAFNLEARLSTLQTGCPYELTLLGEVKFEYTHAAMFAEKSAHMFLEPYAHRGEWFRVPAAVALELMDDLQREVPPVWAAGVEIDVAEAREFDRRYASDHEFRAKIDKMAAAREKRARTKLMRQTA